MKIDNEEQLGNFKKQSNKLFVLIIDGFGVSLANKTNAITLSNTPNLNYIFNTYPTLLLKNLSTQNTINENTYLSLYSQIGKIEFNTDSYNSSELFIKILLKCGLSIFRCGNIDSFLNITYGLNCGENIKNQNDIHKIIPFGIKDYNQISYKFIISQAFKESYKIIDSNKYNIIFSSLPFIATSSYFKDIHKTKQIIEYIDKYIGKLLKKILSYNGTLCIFSTHGFAENIILKQNSKYKTNTPTPFIICNNNYEGITLQKNQTIIKNDLSLLKPAGYLSDIPITLLNLLNIPNLYIPENTKGKNLLNI